MPQQALTDWPRWQDDRGKVAALKPPKPLHSPFTTVQAGPGHSDALHTPPNLLNTEEGIEGSTSDDAAGLHKHPEEEGRDIPAVSKVAIQEVWFFHQDPN